MKEKVKKQDAPVKFAAHEEEFVTEVAELPAQSGKTMLQIGKLVAATRGQGWRDEIRHQHQ